jgi:hypothetical protein
MNIKLIKDKRMKYSSDDAINDLSNPSSTSRSSSRQSRRLLGLNAAVFDDCDGGNPKIFK